MNEQNSDILSKVEKYYQNYGLRAKELKSQGQKIIAYLCSLVPVEIISAAGFVPFRISGDVNEPITKGDTQLETIACPFVRSCFDVSLKGRYDFCEGLVLPHACDSITRTYSVWRYSLDLPYSHFINLPHTVRGPSMDFFRGELETFRKSLGRFAHKEIADSDLIEAIDLYNKNRDKAKALYDLRKSDPPLISGTEMSKILTVGMSLPVTESNELFAEVLEELTQRKEPPVRKAPRIMVDGACIDNIDFVKLIEDSGANVVVDSLCIGTRDYLPHTDVGGDPLDALARRYLDKINCPRTYREKAEGAYEKDLSARFGDIGSLGKEFKVDGVILYVYKYCDPFGFEVPARKAYLDSLNMPVLYLEDEYSAGTIGRLRTRIQAFLEMIE
ncbi:MAG: 2-hydroxyacyl-CoA dehydratase [Deltaproteobacteria bacterium]|nr:2-hydroxyacyl-CoA dehydratase [Deltaproteobacteria bacterium]